jgi:hypothetical protein
MNKLIEILSTKPELIASINKCEREITPILQRYITNFPGYTDHSMEHSKRVLGYLANIIGENVKELNSEEIYILVAGCYLHDVGMSLKASAKLKASKEVKDFYKETGRGVEEYIRRTHHLLSKKFILDNWKTLGIINARYASAISLVAMGHREENLSNFEVFFPKYPVKSGTDFVCIPFLAGVLRIADELDITNDRTPDLLCNKFFPKNKISKQEWEKHKSTYLVNFDGAKILITAETENKDLYISLERQMEKIQESIDAFLKMIRQLPTVNRKLKIDYTRIEPNITPLNFDPKSIRFTFDLPNMFETVIGKRIYGNRFAAIREVLQNSIDACLYRKAMAGGNYTPRISIQIEKDKVVVDDNGLGMDEFIVENYFARLGKSFYTQENISSKYEGISEFGIGVFSYFLLGDCFDVETKMANHKPLKFRVVKDASTPFHFYTDSRRSDPGTSVTILLKESLSVKDLEEYLRRHVAYVDIPIEIHSSLGKTIIQKQNFDVSEKEVLNEVVEKIKHYEIPNLGIIKEHINTESYEGVCWLLLGRKDGKLIPTELFEQVDRYRDKINIYNKGIYVRSLRYDALVENLFGTINFKRKLALTISRDSFSNRAEVNQVLGEFGKRLIEKLFLAWIDADPKSKAEVTSACMGYMFSRYPFGRDAGCQVLNTVSKYFWLKVYRGKGIEYVSLQQLIRQHTKFLIFQEGYEKDKAIRSKSMEQRYERVKLPIIIVNHWDDFALLNYFLSNQHRMEIDCGDDESLHVVCSKRFRKEFPISYFQLMPMNRGWITDTLQCYNPQPLNCRHRVGKFLLKNVKKIEKDAVLQLSVNQFLKNLHSFVYDVYEGKNRNSIKELELLNKSLNEINRVARVKLKLTAKDFPARYNIYALPKKVGGRLGRGERGR